VEDHGEGEWFFSCGACCGPDSQAFCTGSCFEDLWEDLVFEYSELGVVSEEACFIDGDAVEHLLELFHLVWAHSEVGDVLIEVGHFEFDDAMGEPGFDDVFF